MQNHPRPNTDISGPAKRRKTYTIRKQRESWTDQEHQKFLEALGRFGRDWKQIEAFVGTKTLIQIRSHAQKHFEKLERQGDSSAIPPPKPKRRQDGTTQTPVPTSTSPTPPSSQSEALTIPWITTPDALSERPYLNSPEAFAEWMKSNGFLPEHPPPGITTTQMEDMEKQNRQVIQQAVQQVRNLPTHLEPPNHTVEESKPNLGNIYSYLGSLFESGKVEHDPARMANLQQADKQILQLLMHNLLSNLSENQLGDQYRALLQQYEQQIRAHQQSLGGTVIEETVVGPQQQTENAKQNTRKRKSTKTQTKPKKAAKTSKSVKKKSNGSSSPSISDTNEGESVQQLPVPIVIQPTDIPPTLTFPDAPVNDK